MIKINVLNDELKKRYRVVDVAKALGISQNSIYAFLTICTLAQRADFLSIRL